MTKEYWITNSRFKYISLILVLMWVLLLIFLYVKAEEVTTNPCKICAKRTGEDFVCSVKGSSIPVEQIFHPNGSVDYEGIRKGRITIGELNISFNGSQS